MNYPRAKKCFFNENFLFRLQTPKECINMLSDFINDCSQYQSEMQQIPGSIGQYGNLVEPEQKLYWELSADFGYCYIEMCIDWAKRSIKKLEELE